MAQRQTRKSRLFCGECCAALQTPFLLTSPTSNPVSTAAPPSDSHALAEQCGVWLRSCLCLSLSRMRIVIEDIAKTDRSSNWAFPFLLALNIVREVCGKAKRSSEECKGLALRQGAFFEANVIMGGSKREQPHRAVLAPPPRHHSLGNHTI